MINTEKCKHGVRGKDYCDRCATEYTVGTTNKETQVEMLEKEPPTPEQSAEQKINAAINAHRDAILDAVKANKALLDATEWQKKAHYKVQQTREFLEAVQKEVIN